MKCLRHVREVETMSHPSSPNNVKVPCNCALLIYLHTLSMSKSQHVGLDFDGCHWWRSWIFMWFFFIITCAFSYQWAFNRALNTTSFVASFIVSQCLLYVNQPLVYITWRLLLACSSHFFASQPGDVSNTDLVLCYLWSFYKNTFKYN